MVALELIQLTKTWPAIKIQVDLKVEPGNLLALTGPSGCGKSTVLRMIAGLCTPDYGKVMINGIDVTALSPKDRKVGMVFQDYALFPHLDVLDNVCYGLTIRGMPRKDREALAREILDSMGMGKFIRRRPHELSGGEKQRIALARTIAVRPQVVLFDEPLSSLDLELRKHLRVEIRNQQRRFGLTALYVTHDLDEAMAMSDSVAVMSAGCILQSSSPQDLWRNPANATVARFMGSGPCLQILRLESSGQGLIAITATGHFGIRADGLVGQDNDTITTIETLFAVNAKVKQSDNFESGAPKAFIYFERMAAKPVAAQNSDYFESDAMYGHFFATCLRSDFAGDTVDCVLEAGNEELSLRFPSNLAPLPGERVHYAIGLEGIRILFR